MVHHFYDPETFEYRGSMAASGRPGAGAPDNSTSHVPEKREGYAAFWNIKEST